MYDISDKIYDDDLDTFVDYRSCFPLDMRVIDEDNVLNKYELFEKELLATSCMTKEDFFKELSQKYIVDINLLDIYWNTYIKKKEVNKNAGQ